MDGIDPVTDARLASPDKATSLKFCAGTLLLDATPPASTAKLWKWDSRQNAYACFALHYAEVARDVQAHLPACRVEAPNWPTILWPTPNLPPLRPIQQAAIDAWLPFRRGVIVMPTGTGKTEVALSLMQRLAVPTLVVAPLRDLMYQWQQRIQDRLGFDAGIIGDNTFNQRLISVTTYDSACIHMPRLGDQFQFIVFDECHHLPGLVRSDAARMSMAPYRLGLTATPERVDGKETTLDSLIGPVLFRRDIADEAGKDLAPYDTLRVMVRLAPEERAAYDECSRTIRTFFAERRKTDPNYSGVNVHYDWARDPAARRVLMAEYRKKSIEDRAVEKLRVLEDIFRLHPKVPVIVFTNTNVMAREVSVRFLIPCILNHSRKKERREIIEGFRDGRYPAIVANRCLDEGVDLPAAKVAVVLGGGASVRQAVQRLGRVIRKKGEMKAALYEVVCEDTREVHRARARRRNDAYARTRTQRSLR